MISWPVVRDLRGKQLALRFKPHNITITQLEEETNIDLSVDLPTESASPTSRKVQVTPLTAVDAVKLFGTFMEEPLYMVMDDVDGAEYYNEGAIVYWVEKGKTFLITKPVQIWDALPRTSCCVSYMKERRLG